jgi:hypothetical protein
MIEGTGIGRVKLSDGSILKLKILVVDIKESGFSPYGGVNFDVKIVGGIAVEHVPEEIKRLVAGKPLAPPMLPEEGWEILDIVEQEPAVVEEVVNCSKGEFVVKAIAEAIMVSRNTYYRTLQDEPIYSLTWVNKISWKPKR